MRTILNQLHSLANSKNVEGMARYGIVSKKVLGIPVTKLRPMAKEIEDAEKVTEKQKAVCEVSRIQSHGRDCRA